MDGSLYVRIAGRIAMEAQIEHMMAALRHMRRHGASAIEPTREAQSGYVAELERRTKGTVWIAGGCASWYLDSTGRNSTLWPDFSWRFRRRVAHLRPADYHLSFPREAKPSAVSLQPQPVGEASRV